MRVGIIGYGQIGRAVERACQASGDYEVEVIVTKYRIPYLNLAQPRHIATGDKITKEYIDTLKKLDLVFLAIPTDDGLLAYHLLSELTREGIRVVTCEKGALANFSRELWSHLSLIGCSATVGGGSGIIPFLRQENLDQVSSAEFIVNATANFFATRLQQGELDKNEIVHEATLAGILEPGSNDFRSILRSEITGDALRKAVILYNLFFAANRSLRLIETCIDPVGPMGCMEERNDLWLEHLLRNVSGVSKFVVSFFRTDAADREKYEEKSIFRFGGDTWRVAGRFCHPDRDHSPQARLLCIEARDITVGAVLERQDGRIKRCFGPGVGPDITAQAMMRDAQYLLSASK